MSVKESWGKAILYGSYDAIVAISNVLLHPAISELIVELPINTWEVVLKEALNEIREDNNDTYNSSNVSST